MDQNTKKKLIAKSTGRRSDILSDLKKQIEFIETRSGNVPYDLALEMAQTAIRFAAEIGSMADLKSFRPAA